MTNDKPQLFSSCSHFLMHNVMNFVKAVVPDISRRSHKLFTKIQT